MDSENRLTPVNMFFICYEPKSIVNDSPIIFIHGALSSPFTWNKVRNKICETTGRKAYSVCLRNHGDSDWSDEMSVSHLTEDVRHFMLKEHISKAILIGHSLGGRIALAIALGSPEMAEKIIIEETKLSTDDLEHIFAEYGLLLESAANTLKETPSSVPEIVIRKEITSPLVFHWTKNSIGKIFSEPMVPYLPFSKNRSGKFEWDVNIDAIANFLKTIQKHDVPFKEDTVFLGEALFIGAEYSVFKVLEQKDLIEKHFPNSQFVCAKDVHHCCHQEKPEVFVDIVTKFLVP